MGIIANWEEGPQINRIYWITWMGKKKEVRTRIKWIKGLPGWGKARKSEPGLNGLRDYRDWGRRRRGRQKTGDRSQNGRGGSGRREEVVMLPSLVFREGLGESCETSFAL